MVKEDSLDVALGLHEGALRFTLLQAVDEDLVVVTGFRGQSSYEFAFLVEHDLTNVVAERYREPLAFVQVFSRVLVVELPGEDQIIVHAVEGFGLVDDIVDVGQPRLCAEVGVDQMKSRSFSDCNELVDSPVDAEDCVGKFPSLEDSRRLDIEEETVAGLIS